MTKLREIFDNAFLKVYSSNGLWEWLEQEQISIGFTTYQTNRLMLVGRKTNGRLAINERLFDKPMGLYAQGDRLYMSTRYQIWRFDNHLLNGETYQEADRLYVPSQSYTTGSLNVHDLVLGYDGTPIFINTDFSCLATIAEGYSFVPIWQPPFITKLVAEDRCHLNGLAMVDGEPTYVTACSMTDSVAGWRSHRNDGGIVMHIPSNAVVAENLSMPHSPRWYQGKLWLLNAGTGELGYVDDRQFVPIAFCPGFVRGLAFWGDLAIVGLSKLRSASFSGLVLEERLLAEGKTVQCGLMVIDLRNGKTVHSLFLDQPIEELFDVVVLPKVVRPVSLGFQDEDIERLVTFPSSQGLVTTKPTVKRPRDNTLTIAGLPTKERVERENQEAREYEAMERQERLAGVKVKFQRVFHLNPESLAPYDGMTFPSLQHRWQSQPQRGEVIGVSASVLGDMVGFAIAELLPDFKAEIISLFVDPDHRQKGIGTKMLAFLEQEIWSQKFTQITLIYAPTPLTEKALEPILHKLAWTAPRSLAKGFLKVAQKGLPRVNPVNEVAKLKFEEGKSQVQAQNLEQAIACFQEAITLQPDYVAAYNQLGNALQGLGQSEEAIAAYQKILAINPQVAAAHCNLGSIWQMQGKQEQAISSYQKAIEFKPDFVLAYRNLGNLYINGQQFQRAEMIFQKLLQLQPESAGNHQALGNVLAQLGRVEESITCFQNAIKCDRHFLEGHQNLGSLLMMVGEMKLAQNCFQTVLRLDPQNASGYNNLGRVLESQGEFVAALKAYRYALELKPDATDILYQLEHLRLTLCDWENYDRRMAEFQSRLQHHVSDPRLPRLVPLSLNSFPVSLSLHQAVNCHWAFTVTKSMSELKNLCQFSYPIPPNHKIRIGYLSADFRNHAVGFLICSLFQYHNRSSFEVYAYSLCNTADDITEQFKQGCDVFRPIADLSVEAAAKCIHADNIQILIDLGGYTTLCRTEILALQPAPIQINYLGYPDTMGADFIQYILADRSLIPPELAPHYTETILEIPHTFVTSPLKISDQIPSRSDLGLPEEAFVYCCFNRADKFDPHLFTLWMAILGQVPNSVLWLAEVGPDIKQNLEQAAHSQGIDPQRLVFYAKLPWSEYLAIGQRADLFLDTFLYSAGSTAVCVLQAGLPILTCPGESSASRLGASICKAAGLEALICDSPQQYAKQAIYWGTHPDELRKIRDHLMAEKEQLPLFQPQQWIQNLEAVLQTLWQNYLTFHHSPTPTFTLNLGKTLNGGVIFSSHSSQKPSRQTEDFPPLRIVCATGVSPTDFFTETDLGRSLAQVNPPNCELYLFPENTQGLPTLYNRVIEASVTDPAILVFVHDDVQLIDPHWHTKLLKALTVYELVGIAGNKRRLPQQPSWYFVDRDFTPDHSENLSGQIFSWQTQTLSEKPDPKALVSHLYGLLFQSVKLLDGLFLAGYSQTFSDHHLRFEEQFDFHFHALDLSRQAEQKGLKVGTWPIAAIHESRGNYHSTAWQKAYSQYLQKWEPEAA